MEKLILILARAALYASAAFESLIEGEEAVSEQAAA